MERSAIPQSLTLFNRSVKYGLSINCLHSFESKSLLKTMSRCHDVYFIFYSYLVFQRTAHEWDRPHCDKRQSYKTFQINCLICALTLTICKMYSCW